MQELTGKLDDLVGRGRWDEAVSLLCSARELAAERHDDALALSVENELMGIFRMSAREDEFLSAAANARELMKKVRIDRRTRGTILINMATGLAAFARAEEALPVCREAEALFNAVLSPEDVLFAALCNNMSAVFRALGDIESAASYLVRAEKILQKSPHHPDLATTRVNLAQVFALSENGEDRAKEALDRAWEAFDDPEAVWDGYYAHTALKCAGAFEDFGQGERAAELRERADIIYERA